MVYSFHLLSSSSLPFFIFSLPLSLISTFPFQVPHFPSVCYNSFWSSFHCFLFPLLPYHFHHHHHHLIPDGDLYTVSANAKYEKTQTGVRVDANSTITIEVSLEPENRVCQFFINDTQRLPYYYDELPKSVYFGFCLLKQDDAIECISFTDHSEATPIAEDQVGIQFAPPEAFSTLNKDSDIRSVSHTL